MIPRLVLQQLRDFAATLASSRDLREVLMNPSLALQQKLKVVDAIAHRLGMSQSVRNFVAVIMDHQRLDEMDSILAEYSALADTNAGMTEIQIVSARPLEEDERNALMSTAGVRWLGLRSPRASQKTLHFSGEPFSELVPPSTMGV